MTTIFLDMDGVVADFDAYANKVVGYSTPGGKRYPLEDWAKIAANPRFYRHLAVCPGADVLVNNVWQMAKAAGYDVKFLTAIPRANDVPYCFQDKVEWAKENFPDIPVWFGPYSHDKHHHCQPGDILIDDRDDNIRDWNSAGGQGILFRGDVAAAISQLKGIIHV
jgi:5'(3')-deoxyribonucleotidase